MPGALSHILSFVLFAACMLEGRLSAAIIEGYLYWRPTQDLNENNWLIPENSAYLVELGSRKEIPLTFSPKSSEQSHGLLLLANAAIVRLSGRWSDPSKNDEFFVSETELPNIKSRWDLLSAFEGRWESTSGQLHQFKMLGDGTLGFFKFGGASWTEMAQYLGLGLVLDNRQSYVLSPSERIGLSTLSSSSVEKGYDAHRGYFVELSSRRLHVKSDFKDLNEMMFGDPVPESEEVLFAEKTRYRIYEKFTAEILVNKTIDYSLKSYQDLLPYLDEEQLRANFEREVFKKKDLIRFWSISTLQRDCATLFPDLP